MWKQWEMLVPCIYSSEKERKKHMKQQEDVAKCERIVFQF